MMTAKAATARSHIGLRGVGSSAIAGAVPVAGVTLVVNGRLVPPARVTPPTGVGPTRERQWESRPRSTRRPAQYPCPASIAADRRECLLRVDSEDSRLKTQTKKPTVSIYFPCRVSKHTAEYQDWAPLFRRMESSWCSFARMVRLRWEKFSSCRQMVAKLIA